jgi:hypothetical protein
MPEPVNTNTQKMEARLDALGMEMRSIKLTLSNMLMEQEKFHDQLIAMLTKKLKRTDDGGWKIEASENHSTSEVHTTMGLKKPEVEPFNVKLQKNQETMKEEEPSNIEQSHKMKMSDDRSKFGGVIFVSRSQETPISILKSPIALERKLGSNGKETQAAGCSDTVLPPPKPPDADRYTVKAVMEIAGGSAMVSPPPKPPETLHVDLEETGLRVFDFSPPSATPMKRYVTRREAPLTEGTKQPSDPPDSDRHTAVTPRSQNRRILHVVGGISSFLKMRRF